jgi:hypothetical protein
MFESASGYAAEKSAWQRIVLTMTVGAFARFWERTPI